MAGLSIAVIAHNRANQVLQECTSALRRQMQVVDGEIDHQALRDVAIVHYDALKEMAGRRSFSLAMINSAGDGIVLSSINGRTETRTYAKAVRAGRGIEVLSPEEDQVVRAARLGRGPVVSMDDPLPDYGTGNGSSAPSAHV
ncbi:DUF4446 family protein [Actinomadura craniellae]|uniref:DUF4446 family protein n=1 Tax=Actinomadura craniellae TaxID=2231787 RepID=UPI001F292A64|nr:DUF4446 family protein [Actinomadura craniellae]